ncbi:FUSC family protein [Peptostreptococcus russellii]|uniref:FUSC family protein n=1 Tax=Peptostreptococcus russellii TaxID=215200 RepID=UPI0026EFEC39|nr:FUSC family protein [Peptostreptococcus russellii]
MKKDTNLKSFLITFLKNVKMFIFMMIFILTFIKFFGPDNTLIVVCIYVGLVMFPACDTGMTKKAMLAVIAFCYIGSTLIAQLNTISPWIALPFNLVFVFLVMAATSEPTYLKMNVIMLLPFIFNESVPVDFDGFKIRMAATLIGTFIIMVCTYIQWTKKGYGADGSRTLVEQLRKGLKHVNTALRMTLGVSFALILSTILKSQKPLWITIVVVSLTQFTSQEMISRIKYRVMGTILGSIFFVIAFRYILPIESGIVVVFLFNFIGSFLDEYKYKQFINTVSAINASLIIFNTDRAIVGRFTGLLIGILIVCLLYLLEKLIIAKFKKTAN